MVDPQSNLRSLLQKNPELNDVFDKLNKNNVRYGLYAGSYVSLFTSNRIPTDIDIMVADEDLKETESLFKVDRILQGKEVTKEITTDGISFYLYGDLVEFVARLSIIVNKKVYAVRLTSLVWKNISYIDVNNLKVNILPPEDTIIIKAILRRGREYKKHDLEDIDALAKVIRIDKDYMSKRLHEVGADERVTKVLLKHNVYS